MRQFALAIVLAAPSAGCAFFFDDDKYSENYGRDASSIDTSSVDASVVDSAALESSTETSTVDTSTVDTSRPEDVTCPGGEVFCGGGCTSLTTNANCGACGNDCAKHGPEATCVGGKCTCPGDRCPATGDTFVCTNRSEDPLNCGTCGNKCPDGEYCRAGGCSCMPPLVRCSSGCVDVGGHHNHCGACSFYCSAANNTCRATSTLDGYRCTLDTYGCPAGRTHCDGDHCFDTKVDETNCGGCGFKCASNQVCANGICRAYTTRASTCPPGTIECSPLPGNTERICVAGSLCPG